MLTVEKFRNNQAGESGQAEVLTLDPELIKAVDEAFISGITKLEGLQINPELERHLGAWVKLSGGDRTSGELTEE